MSRHGAARTVRTGVVCVFAVLQGAASAALADDLPKVASINLCTDQLVLSLAEPEQILSVSWLSADPEESMLAEQASRHLLNYGMAEEMIRLAPDVVIAGSYTSAFTRHLLRNLGYSVVDIEPAIDIEGIASNLRRVGDAVGQPERANALVEAMYKKLDSIRADAAPARPDVIVLRPGGFTVERPSLADSLISIAGLSNVTADRGLDRWGSLPMETLLTSRPDMIVTADYRNREPSIANTAFDHPVLARLHADLPAVSIPSSLWACGLPRSLDSARTLADTGRAVPGPADGSRQ